MSLPFAEVSNLLSRLEKIELHDPPYLDAKAKANDIQNVVESWFKSHRCVINDLSIKGSVALISALLPERRTDRVYAIQAPRLCSALSCCLRLGSARVKDLQAYQQPGRGDLGACVERVLKDGGPPASPAPTLGEVDDMLAHLAAQSRFSAPAITKVPSRSFLSREKLLGDMFKRLSPLEGKWLVRLILKDLSPVRIEQRLMLRAYHFLLPDLLQFQDDLSSAIGLVKTTFNGYPSSCDIRSESLHRARVRENLKPLVGVKVGRPTWRKAWSLDNCFQMTGGQRWVLERKYDGEYCEIHVDMTRSTDVSKSITIFSKSGKDSTSDRAKLHDTLIECLRLGRSDSKIKRSAILLGEMLAYSDLQRCVLPLHRIRQHVTRSGKLMGIDGDLPPERDEHLAIAFFDIMLLDDELLLNKSIEERRMWLREVYSKIPGRAMSVEWKVIDFAEERAKERLVDQFAASIEERCEGLILKPCGVPYFALPSGANGRVQSYIKLKKDYMKNLGDEADLAVIGASFDAQQAAKCALPNMQWTNFHLGCLLNKNDVVRYDVRPRFRVVATIQQEFCVPKNILKESNSLGNFRVNDAAPFDLEPSHIQPEIGTLFAEPLVWEVLGSGFEKPSNANFYMLRHPRVKKLHRDRSWKDCVSFQELQMQAREAMDKPQDAESEETRRKINKSMMKYRKKVERERTKTPSTVQTSTTRRSVDTCDSSATRSSRAHLQRTTLVGSSLKRKRHEDTAARETPCPASKKLRSSITRSSPLSDITNAAAIAPRAPPSPPTAHISASSPALTNCRSKAKDRKTISHLTTLFLPTPPSSLGNATLPSPDPRFSLADTDVYLAPSLANRSSRFSKSQLRSKHKNLAIVDDLAEWEQRRESSTPLHYTADERGGGAGVGDSPLEEVVEDSQPSPARRRIVLINPEELEETASIRKRVRKLRKSACRHCGHNDEVEIWDWRFIADDKGGKVNDARHGARTLTAA